MFGLPPLPRTLGAALRDVGHTRPDVRHSALRDLVRHTGGDARGEALAAIERVLASDASPALRAEAAVSLADADAVESVPALAQALGDAEERVRQMATLAFGELAEPGNAEHVARVRPLLAAREAPVRFQALIAFVRLCPQKAESLFVTALADGDDEVRAMALRLMDLHYDEPGSAPDHLVARARAALGDSAAVVRATAALFLVPRGERAADPVLAGVIDGSVATANGADLLSAIELAASEKIEAARPGLRFRTFGPLGLRSDPFSWHALVALGTLGDERARRTILRGLSAWTRHTRTLSVLAAGRVGLVEARARIDALRGRPARADQTVVDEALAALDRIAG